MKTSLKTTLIHAAAAVCLVVPAHAQLMLYDGTLSQAVTDINGASTGTFSTVTPSYHMYGYNTTNVTYTENESAPFGSTGNKQVVAVNNGAVDGVFRYNFLPSAVKAFAGSRTFANEPLLFNIDSFSTLSFDVQYAGDSTFGSVQVDVSSGTASAPSVTLLDQGLTANTPTNITVNLGTGSAFQTWVDQMGAASSLGSYAQLRILMQTGTGDPGTFYFDNVQLIPEPSTALLIGLSAGLLLLRRRRR